MVKVRLCALLCLDSVVGWDVSVTLAHSGFKRRGLAVIGREAQLGAGARGSNSVCGVQLLLVLQLIPRGDRVHRILY